MRDLYAIAAMHGLTQRGLLEDVSEGQGDTEAAWLIADLSYKVADAMLHAAFKDKTDDKTT